MRDYSCYLEDRIVWKSNHEISEFEKAYKKMIIGILRKSGVDFSDCEILYNDILIKFGRGKLEYDESKGKFETYLYRITENCAKDYHRSCTKKQKLEEEITEKTTSTLYDFSLDMRNDFEYYRQIAVETLKRLYQKNQKNKVKMEIFTKHYFGDEKIQNLAEKYQKSKSEISLTASRFYFRYKKIFHEVEKEMESERMKESNISIDYLAPIMDFSLSVA